MGETGEDEPSLFNRLTLGRTPVDPAPPVTQIRPSRRGAAAASAGAAWVLLVNCGVAELVKKIPAVSAQTTRPIEILNRDFITASCFL
jgi:hypothetical protein